MEKLIKFFSVRTWRERWVNDIIKVIEFLGTKWDAPDGATQILDHDNNGLIHDHTVVAIPDDLSVTISVMIGLEEEYRSLEQRLEEIRSDIKLLGYGFTIKAETQGIKYPVFFHIDNEVYIIEKEQRDFGLNHITIKKGSIFSKGRDWIGVTR